MPRKTNFNLTESIKDGFIPPEIFASIVENVHSGKITKKQGKELIKHFVSETFKQSLFATFEVIKMMKRVFKENVIFNDNNWSVDKEKLLKTVKSELDKMDLKDFDYKELTELYLKDDLFIKALHE